MDARILKGNEVRPPFKYSQLCSIQFDNRHRCNGIKLNSNWILTAAQCNNEPNSHWSIKCHRHNLSRTNSEESGKEFEVTDIIQHPNFDQETKENDLALWRLEGTESSNGKLEVEFDRENSVKYSTRYKVIGWGQTSLLDTQNSIPTEYNLKVIPSKECNSIYSGLGREIDVQKQFCLGDNDSRNSACIGDLGSPVVKLGYSQSFNLVGIFSWGNCGVNGQPGVYLKLDEYLNWIKKIIN